MRRLLLASAASLSAAMAFTAAPALADCGEEITAFKTEMESRAPEVMAPQEEKAGVKTGAEVEMKKSDGTEVEMETEAQAEAGGTTTFAGDGPAEPRENWFGFPPGSHPAQASYEAAQLANSKADEEACLLHIAEARQALEKSAEMSAEAEGEASGEATVQQ